MGLQNFLLFMLVLTCASQTCQAWGWFSSSAARESVHDSSARGGYQAEYSIEAFNNPKAMEVLENARKELAGHDSCLKGAYGNLISGCSKIFADEEKRSRFAWRLADCYQRGSGKSLPDCNPRASMLSCRKKLNENDDSVFRAYFIEANTICFQLQTQAFKHETQRLVNELKTTAQLTQDKLETIEEKSDHLVQNSNQIQESLTSIDIQTERVAQTTKNVRDNIGLVLQSTEAVSEQASLIRASQSEIREAQGELRGRIESGMAMLQDSYSNLGVEIDGLRNEAVEIEREISRVGDAVSDKMEKLQSKADDIGSVAGESLARQKQVLDGQEKAMERLQDMTRFQSQALSESRTNLQQLADYSRIQKEELIRREEQRHEQLQRSHDRLAENSKSILAAQEAFESKQANMFLALDKLFDLHNAMLVESRVVKSIFVYTVASLGIYLVTSTKQTYNVRHRLYMGLCAALFVEVSILRSTSSDFEHRQWMIDFARNTCLVLAALQLLYAIFTYRDYDVLNHNMLVTLMDMMNGMQRNKGVFGDYEENEEDDDVNWCKWIDQDLPEDMDLSEDPDYAPPAKSDSMVPAKIDAGFRYSLRRRR